MSKSVTNQRKNYKPATIHKTNQNVSKEVTLSKKDYAPAPRFRVSGHPPTSIRDLSVKGKVGDPFFMVRASDGNHYIIMTGDRYLASKTYNCDISTMPCHRRNFFNGGIYDDTNDYYILYHELLNNNDPAEVALIKEVRDPKSRKRLSESEEQAILDGVSAAIASGDSVVGNDSERWELKLVLPIDQINDPFGQQCERRSGCQLAACCIWSGSKDPSTPWYCCLDCQEKDFEGWPAENNDIPLKVMSRALRNAMITRVRCVCVLFCDIRSCQLLLTHHCPIQCSKYPSPNMPNLPESEETNTRTRSSSQRRAAAVAASVISSSHSPQDSAAITSHPKRSAASVETSDSKPSRKRSKQLGSKRRDVITSTTPIDVRCFACFNINQKTASQCVTTATSSSCSRPEGNNCTFCGSSGNKWVPGTIDTGFVVLNNETNEALDLFKTKNEVYNNYYKNEEIGANALKNRLEPLINKDEDSVVLGSYRIERDNHVHFRNGKPGLNLRCLHEGCSWRTKNGKSYCGLHAKMHPGEA